MPLTSQVARQNRLVRGAQAGSGLIITGVPTLKATDGAVYDRFFADAANGVEPYAFSLVGTWPTGITVNASTGRVHGTPTQNGTFASLKVRVTDDDAATADLGPFTLVVAAAVAATATPVEDAALGQAYAGFQVGVTGGTAPFAYALVGDWPSGLSVNASGIVSGTPTESGSFTGLSVSATDLYGSTDNIDAFDLEVADTLGITGTPVLTATLGRAYTGFTCSGVGGTAPYTFAKVGSWPPGLLVHPTSGVVSGTPTLSGTFNAISVMVTDALGSSAVLTPFSVVVALAVSIFGTPVLKATNGSLYAGFTVTSSGGTAPIAYAKVGTWPTGLTLDTATGVVSGTPTQTGSFAGMSVSATDAYGSAAQLATFTLVVAAAVGISGTPVLTATAGRAYTGFTATASGGTAPLTYSKVGTWPAGLSQNAGVVSGTPTQSGSFAGMSVKAVDVYGSTASLTPFTLVVAAAVSITGVPVTIATEDVPYTGFTASKTGGTAPVVFALVGTWPAGLTINSSTGAVSGTPTENGVFNGLSVSATDAYGSTDSLDVFSIDVKAAGAEATWGDARLLATNMGPNYDFTTRVSVNALHQSRGFNVPGTYTSVALKSNGYPQAGTDSECYFLTAADASEAGDYLFECVGDETGSGKLVGLGATVSGKTFAGGKTTATFTTTGAFSGLGVRLTSANASLDGVKMHPPGYPLNTTDLFTAAALHHYGPFAVVREMDWGETNGPETGGGGNQDTDWATSRASRGLTDARARHGLEYGFAFAEAINADPWTNVPAKFTDAAIASYVGAGLGFLQAGRVWYIEAPANEPWNFDFVGTSDLRTDAFDTAEIRAGADITSLSRLLGIVTAGVGSGHGKSIGNSIYVRQKNALFAQGIEVITGTTSSTISWADSTGGDGAIAHTDDNTAIYLNPTNELVKQVTAYHVPDPWPTAAQARFRYHLTRSRQPYEAALALSAQDSVRVIYGVQMGNTLFDYLDAMFWAAEKYGDMEWLYAMSPALYLLPANPGNADTVDKVFTQLEAARAAILPFALKWGNVMRSMGMHLAFYEGLEHTNDFAGNSAAFIAAHADDRMRVLNKALMQDTRNVGADLMCGFFSGWRKAISNGLESWVDVVGDFTTGDTQAKHKVWNELFDESANGVQISGQNFGDINLVDVFLGGFQPAANGQFYCNADKRTPDNGYTVNVCVDTDRTYTIKADFAKVSGTVPATLWVDGNQVAAANLPTVASVFSGPKAGEAFSIAMPLTAGNHTVSVRLPNPTRAGQFAASRIRVN